MPPHRPRQRQQRRLAPHGDRRTARPRAPAVRGLRRRRGQACHSPLRPGPRHFPAVPLRRLHDELLGCRRPDAHHILLAAAVPGRRRPVSRPVGPAADSRLRGRSVGVPRRRLGHPPHRALLPPHRRRLRAAAVQHGAAGALLRRLGRVQGRDGNGLGHGVARGWLWCASSLQTRTVCKQAD